MYILFIGPLANQLMVTDRRLNGPNHEQAFPNSAVDHLMAIGPLTNHMLTFSSALVFAMGKATATDIIGKLSVCRDMLACTCSSPGVSIVVNLRRKETDFSFIW